MARRNAPLIPDELLDELLAGRDPQSSLGRDGLIDELKRALAECLPSFPELQPHPASPSALAPLGLPARRGTCSTIRRSTPRSLPPRQRRAWCPSRRRHAHGEPGATQIPVGRGERQAAALCRRRAHLPRPGQPAPAAGAVRP